MFTIRFMNGGDSTVVSGARFDVNHRLTADQEKPAFAIVSVYPAMTSDQGGVDFHVGPGREDHPSNQGYAVCYIENEAGKTIDRIGPFSDE